MTGQRTLTGIRTRHAVTGSWGLFTAVTLMMIGNGLLGTVLGVRAELEGFATAATGVVMASYYVGFLFGSQAAPVAVNRVGHVRVFAALASLGSITALVHAIAVTPPVWGAMRFVFGVCQAGLYVVAESWLNDTATNDNRGRLMSIYMVTVMGGIGVGQLLLSAADPGGFTLFVVASVLVSLSVVPISLSIGRAPAFELHERLGIKQLWQMAPLGIVGGLGTGVSNGALFGLGAVFGVRAGMSPGRIALFLGASALGAIVWQWPIGSISDRVPRRRWLLTVTLLASLASIVAGVVPTDGWTILLAMFMLGGLILPMYSLSLSHLNDLVPTGAALSASAAYVFVAGVGAILGPLTAALAMDVIGPDGLFWTIGLVHAAIGAFALVRIVVKAPIPISEQLPYIRVPNRSPLIALRSRVWRRTRD